MRTAMILTGGLRTFEKTAAALFKHIVEPNNCTLFVVCESEEDPTELIQSKFPGIEIGGMLWAPSFRSDSEGFNGIADDTFNSDRPGLTDEVFARAGWDPVVGKEWIRSGSGSLVQWYQLWLSWFLVSGYEMRNDMKFDICMKSRFDLLFTETIQLTDFFSGEWTTSEEEMRSLGNTRMRSNPTDVSNGYADEVGTPLGTFDTTVWTFGIELAILAKRDTFELLVSTIFNYGKWDSGLTSSFNSETTFHQYCKSLGLIHWAYQDIGFPLYSTDINSQWTFVILR
jgi:hypothetical protein